MRFIKMSREELRVLKEYIGKDAADSSANKEEKEEEVIVEEE